MQAFLPEGLSALSSIVRNWTFSLFYLMSELWGSVVVSVLVSRRRHRNDFCFFVGLFVRAASVDD